MSKYTKKLPSSTECKTEWSYPDPEQPLSPATIRDITERMDPYHVERTDVDLLLKKYVVDSFVICRRKFQILHLINTGIEERAKANTPPSDVMMLIFFEDSLKLLTISLNDVVDKLKSFVNGHVRGRCMHLLKRNGLRQTVDTLKASVPQQASKYEARFCDYTAAWNSMFSMGPNCKGKPKEEDFSQLVDKIHEDSEKLKTYRDKVAAHVEEHASDGQAMPTLLWSELQAIIGRLECTINNLHFLLTFRSLDFEAGDGPGFRSNESTAEAFLNAIF